MRPDPKKLNTKEEKEAYLRYASNSKLSNAVDNETLQNYRIAAGKINFTDYSYITNPYGLKDDRYQKYPAKLKNYDFISSIFLQLISEYGNRPFNPIVYNKNSNFNNEKQEYEKQLIDQSVQQRFVNKLIEKGQFIKGQTDEQGNPVAEPMSPEVIQSKVSSLKDRLTIEAQTTLDYVISKEHYETKYRREFYDFVVGNVCAGFKTIINDEVVRLSVIPANLSFTRHSNLEFLDDCEIINYSTKFSLTDIVDVFWEEENFEKIFDYCNEKFSVEVKSGTSSYTSDTLNTKLNDVQGDVTDSIDVQHIQFTSYKEVADITLPNGEVITIDKDYVSFIDEKLEWRWVSEKREGYVIDNHFFLGGDPVKYPVGDNKNNYTGKIFMDNKIENQHTLPFKLASFQEAVNVCEFKIQFIFNKFKGDTSMMPLSLITNLRDTANANNLDLEGKQVVNQTMDNEDNIAKNLYYADATGYFFVDDTSENAQIALQMLKNMPASSSNTIQFLLQYRDNIKENGKELVGFNRFRTAGINSSDAVGNVQQGSYGASLITEEYFKEFDEYVENDLQGTINLAKYAYKKGKRANFVRSDGNMAMLEVSGDFSYGDYGIFATNNSKMQQLLDIVKQRSNEFLQNGKASTWIKLMSQSSNFASIIQTVENAEEEIAQQQQAQMQNDQQIAQQQIQATAQENQLDRDLKKYDIDANIELEYAKLGQQPNEETPNVDISKNLNDTNKMLLDERKSVRDSNAKRYVADQQFKIAKENKNV